VDDGHTFNLISTPWLPVIRASGRRDCVRPADLTDGIDVDPIIDVDWPRGDFRCATLEFLIGLLTVACPPRDNWGGWWTRPPSKTDLEATFAPFTAVFSFDGEGARAYQDFEDMQAGSTPIESLLIEAPGVETEKRMPRSW